MKLCGLSKEGEARFAELLKEDEAADEYVVMTTLRYDRELKHLTRRVPIAMEDSDEDVFFLSRLHHRRLRYGSQLLGYETQISHTKMVSEMNAAVAANGLEHPQRVRVTVTRSGAMEVVASCIASRDDLFSGLSTSPPQMGSLDPIYTVYISAKQHKPQVSNMIKTTARDEYNELRTQLKSTNEEILLVGTNGEILEGTTTSVAFKRGEEWITPSTTNGGMVGTTRSLLLGLKFVREGTILKSEIQDGERVLLFNGVVGVVAGHIRL